MNNYLLLKQAEDFCSNMGQDIDFWFKQHYTSYREYQGVLESVEAAMKALDLYNQFQSTVKTDKAFCI